MKAILSTAYETQGIMASAQRCVNLYAEKNPEDSPFPFTYHLTPGLQQIAEVASFGWRALYKSTLDTLYGVCGYEIYSITVMDGVYAATKIGSMGTGSGGVSMVDNGTDVVIVDGSDKGYRIKMLDNTVTFITNDAFYGANRVDLVDGYLLFNRPATNQFYISKFLEVDFDSLDFAAKTGFSDKLVGVGATKRQVFLFGKQTTEVWYNTGDADFTFGRMPGAFIQHGCASAATICQFDGSLYWISTTAEGEFMVLRTEGYDRARISTFAIEAEIAKYPTVTDATAFIHQMNGHPFYVLNFPSANKTWAYDISNGKWAERMWLSDNGIENRHRANCQAFFNGETIVGDWENGKLYRMSDTLFTDNGEEIRRIRSFPHMVDDGNRITYWKFQADIQTGEGVPFLDPVPELRLRWSDTRGRNWKESISQQLGFIGDFQYTATFNRLGMARDRVFELSWVANDKTALNGAFLQFAPRGS